MANETGSPIVLALPYPISANRYWATRALRDKKTGHWMAMTYVTPEAKEYRAEVARIASKVGLAEPLSCRVQLELLLFPHRPLDWKTRMRKLGPGWDDSVQCIDLGNAEKVLSDALQGVVIADDKQFWRQTKQRMEPDAHGARVIVRITPIVLHTPQEALL